VVFNIKSAPVTSPQAAADIDDWRRNIATILPNGQGGIKCVDATKECTITITWDELNSSGLPADNVSKFEYKARL
jgi:type IV pilus assembly protein PilV